MKNTCSVILAAGDGNRMFSAKPKALCEVLFKPMIRWVADSCTRAGILSNCVVLGNGADLVRPFLPQNFDVVLQTQRLGTGHAASMAKEYIKEGGFQDVLVLYGDAPFFTPQTLQLAYNQHKEQGNAVTLLSAKVENPTGYGRIVRSGTSVVAVVEQSDADEATKQINEINAGVYWLDATFLLSFFENMSNSNAQGEYYLTDCVAFAVEKGLQVGGFVVEDSESTLGANDRKGLQKLNQIARRRILDALLEQGVDIPLEDGILVGPDVQVGADTQLLPGTILKGNTTIGKSCRIGPNSFIENSTLGDGCHILSSYIDSSTLESGVKIGPMSNVRPGCHIQSGAKIGDFVELKNANIGEATAVAHLTYIGDSDVGARCNFGCGVVVVNYDGTAKHRTTIGNNAFIGCNTNLVSPVSLGDGAYSAAGTTVTEDVPAGALVIGRARQVVKEGWAKEHGKYRRKG